MTAEQIQVAAEPCRCVRCADCGGRGSYWVDLRGRYLGIHRSDDMDEMETCESCGGSGIDDTCDRCQLLEDMDHEAG